MKINNITMLAGIETMNKFPKAKGAMGYAMSRNTRIFMQELQDFYKERDKLIQKYGTEDADGKLSIDKNSSNWVAFLQEYQPLLDIEIDVNVFQIDESEMVILDDATKQDYDILYTILVKP